MTTPTQRIVVCAGCGREMDERTWELAHRNISLNPDCKASPKPLDTEAAIPAGQTPETPPASSVMAEQQPGGAKKKKRGIFSELSPEQRRELGRKGAKARWARIQTDPPVSQPEPGIESSTNRGEGAGDQTPADKASHPTPSRKKGSAELRVPTRAFVDTAFIDGRVLLFYDAFARKNPEYTGNLGEFLLDCVEGYTRDHPEAFGFGELIRLSLDGQGKEGGERQWSESGSTT